jgi:hypothetical protein
MTIRTLLIVIVLFGAAGMATYFIQNEPPTQIGASLTREDQSHDYHTSVSLTFKEFHPAGNLFTGSIAIEMVPSPDRPKPESKQLLLRFDRYEEPNRLIYQGGGDEPIAIGSRPAWGSLTGKGAFSWAGLSRPGPFFDEYAQGLVHAEFARHGRPVSAVDARVLLGRSDIVLVDPRERAERERHGTIPGALHAPYPALQENIAVGDRPAGRSNRARGAQQ